MKNANVLLWLDYVAVVIVVAVFFIISYCGFFRADDLSMAYGGTPIGFGERIIEISSVYDVFKLTWWWYFHLGGRFFSVAAQYFFCGLIGNKVWFDIVNTFFFVLLIVVCGSLVGDGKKGRVYYVLLFALLFWLLCPKPDEDLFWVAGSTTHLWGNTLAFVLLWFFLKYRDANFGIIGKLGLFFLSIFTAAEFIPCASVCGAFVVYYVFHVKYFKGNAVPFVVGFVIGSMLVLFAPGNFERAIELEPSFTSKIKGLVFHPVQEIIKYKVLWIFLMVVVVGWTKNKMVVKSWMKNNAILLLSIGWSVIAFSVVFRPDNRALFFPETLSLVLLLKFLFDNYQIFGFRFFNEMRRDDSPAVRCFVMAILFAIFTGDSVWAITETHNQSKNNDMLLKKIEDSGGIVALDQVISSHRMAYVSACLCKWTWEPLADRFGLDSVHVYPYYCQDKYYKQAPPLENIYIDDYNYKNIDDIFGKYVLMYVRIESEKMQGQSNNVVFAIDYSRPRKWYKTWLDKRRNYQYDRTEVVERNAPDVCFDGYCYYVIWFGRENSKNLKSINYEFK